MRYYGYKLDEVMSLDVCKYNTLIKLMYINEARDTLKMHEAAHYPTYTKDSKEKIRRKYYKLAHPASFEIKNVVKLGDLKGALNG